MGHSRCQQFCIERLLSFEHDGQIEVMHFRELLFKEPVLNWRQRDCSGHKVLLSTDRLKRGRYLRQLGNRLVLVKLSRREMQASTTSLRDELQTQNRITPETKKVIVNAHTLDTKNLGPDSRQYVFHCGARSHVVVARCLNRFELGKLALVHLAMRVQRKRLQQHK